MKPQRSAVAVAFLLALGIGSTTPALAHGDKAKSAQAATVEPVPAAEADRDLAQKVASALNADTTFKSSAIQVASTDGKISLDGRVPSVAQQEKAEHVAKKVPGVSGVINSIRAEH